MQYPTYSGNSGSILAGATGTFEIAVGPSVFNLLSVLAVANGAPGASANMNVRFFTHSDYANGHRVARWEIQGNPLYYPIDRTTGVPTQALYGLPICYTDLLNAGKLYVQIENLDTVAHNYDLSGYYYEVPVMSAGGGPTFRAGVVAPTIGPATGQQHTLPVVTSDTIALLSAAQTFINKAISGNTNTLTNIGNASLVNPGLTVTAGTGMSGGGAVALGSSVTLNNAGVTAAIGTANHVNVSGATGAVTFSLPQAINAGATPAFAGLILGTSPATTGLLNLGNGGIVKWRNHLNLADLSVFQVNGVDSLIISDIAFVQVRVAAGGFISLNDLGADVDVTIASDLNANHFVSDAGLLGGNGAFQFGNISIRENGFITEDMPDSTIPADIEFSRHWIFAGNSLRVPTGLAQTVSTLRLDEPNIVATGTVDVASTLYISGAPTQGTVKAALYVNSGATILKGNTIFGAPARLMGYTVATLPAGTLGDTAYVTDALAPTFLATVVGGGAIKTPVFYNGSNWVGF